MTSRSIEAVLKAAQCVHAAFSLLGAQGRLQLDRFDVLCRCRKCSESRLRTIILMPGCKQPQTAPGSAQAPHRVQGAALLEYRCPVERSPRGLQVLTYDHLLRLGKAGRRTHTG